MTQNYNLKKQFPDRLKEATNNPPGILSDVERLVRDVAYFNHLGFFIILFQVINKLSI